MIVFDREKSVIDGIFGDKAIIKEKDIAIHGGGKKTPEKEFLSYYREKLIELIKENSYYLYQPDGDAESGGTCYFIRSDRLEEEYACLDEKVKEFFNRDIAEYAEYRILKQHKKDCDNW